MGNACGRGRLAKLGAVLGSLVLCGLAACRQADSPPPQPRDVVLIVIDTLRADRLGSYGRATAHTPVLDALAARGTRFAHAYAPSSWTMPSVASLLTSRLPSQHQVSSFNSALHEDEVTLAEHLEEAGFLTYGATANWRLSRELGFAQGLRTWQPIMVETKTTGDRVRQAAERWLNDTRDPAIGPRSRRLLYLQYMEPHMPLLPSETLRARFAPGVSEEEAVQLSREVNDRPLGGTPIAPQQAALLSRLYDGEVAAVDAEIGLLLQELNAVDRLSQTLIIITADHGEEFLEHGAVGHGYNLFNTTVRVPLILYGPGIPAGRVIEQPVSLIDIAPTVLDLLDLAPEPRFEGRSLVPLLRGGRADGADIVLQLPRANANRDPRQHEDGLVRDLDKLLVDVGGGAARVYDLAADPDEQAPLVTADGTLRAALTAATAALADRQQPAAAEVVIDEATRETLRALGYGN